MLIEKINIEELKEYENNAKEHPEEQINQIIESIKMFGFNDPIAIDENNMIIEGHGRLYALQKLGYEQVDCIRLSHLSKKEKKAYILAHNKLTMNTGFDIEKLNLELDSIDDIDMSLFGFELFEPEAEVIEDDYEVVLPEEPKAKLGEVYELGKHRLMCGDSTKVEDVEKLMNGEQANMLLTDPPYNVDYQGKTKDALKIINDKMPDDKFRLFLFDAFKCANEVMKEGAVFYIWHADSEGYNFRGACCDTGWKIRQCLIWNKNSLILGRQDYHWKHEPCLYGWKEGAGHIWAGDRKQTTVLDFDKPTVNAEHPTMKPVALFDYQIKNNTKKNDKVLDLFAGSGTTIIACEQNERIGYCMELDPKYVDVIIDRWEKLSGGKAIKIS